MRKVVLAVVVALALAALAQSAGAFGRPMPPELGITWKCTEFTVSGRCAN